MELAYQLKIDVRKREEEIVELDTEVKIKVNYVYKKTIHLYSLQVEYKCSDLFGVQGTH